MKSFLFPAINKFAFGCIFLYPMMYWAEKNKANKLDRIHFDRLTEDSFDYQSL